MACTLAFEERGNMSVSAAAVLMAGARQSVDADSSIHYNTSNVYPQADEVVVFEASSADQRYCGALPAVFGEEEVEKAVCFGLEERIDTECIKFYSSAQGKSDLEGKNIRKQTR
ncbi:hypothetical protein DPV78_010033 [Talaromyces pinophilus]|nr:hypothetical protein DPV78_010033 [Talaromyces pinophilus]